MELLRFLSSFGSGELLVEAVDAAIAHDDALVARIEGVALGAGIDFDFLQRRAGLEGASAGRAGNDAVMVLRMDVFLHCYTPFAVRPIAAQRALQGYSL